MSLQHAAELAVLVFIAACVLPPLIEARLKRRRRNRRWPRGRPVAIGFKACPPQEQQRT